MTVGNDLVNWMLNRQYRYFYSQGPSRLNPESHLMTDCSALVRYCYQQVAGIEVGTWTGDQQNYGFVVVDTNVQTADEAMHSMLPGDLVFFEWDGIGAQFYDHVEMYMGNNQTIGHGGPGKGPIVKSFSQQWGWAHTVSVRRYLIDDGDGSYASESKVTHVPDNFPLPYPLPWNHYFGDIKGDDRSHGGYYDNERPWVKAIQQGLIMLGCVPGVTNSNDGWADGLYEQATVDAAVRFQSMFRADSTNNWGQIWDDDLVTMRDLLES